MSGVQPAELWQESGRWDAYGPELLRFEDRHERMVDVAGEVKFDAGRALFFDISGSLFWDAGFYFDAETSLLTFSRDVALAGDLMTLTLRQDEDESDLPREDEEPELNEPGEPDVEVAYSLSYPVISTTVVHEGRAMSFEAPADAGRLKEQSCEGVLTTFFGGADPSFEFQLSCLDEEGPWWEKWRGIFKLRGDMVVLDDQLSERLRSFKISRGEGFVALDSIDAAEEGAVLGFVLAVGE